MPFPPSAACRFFDLPPVNLQNLPLHLTKNSFASAPTHLCGIALETRQESQLEGLSSVSLRLTAPSAERVKGDFASAEARRWTEPVWQLSDRPRHPFGSALISEYRLACWQVAAALSAAVTTTKQQEIDLTSQAEPSQKKCPRQTPATLREGARGRGFS